MRTVAEETVMCKFCNLPFNIEPWRKAKFCSRTCFYSHNRGENHSRYRHGGYLEKGYHVLLQNGRYVGVHRSIAERVLGRPLKHGEVVHHLNGDKKDNRNANLLICSNSYHQWLHAEMSLRYARERFGNGNGKK